ncbi:lysozyme [Nodosilinea sp. FACHB-131]|uniref:lysozyme n=1 Tax=Cyanophyceae TaxID=3028117 RepID=UPI001689B895|nr:lysozyme [Nodosilinea sp. FACHB-131]MBD1874168.1 lysozyme [Nodosilinea sp. FACHB-131]
MDDDKLPPVWHKVQILSGLAASVLVPLSIGMVRQGINAKGYSPAPLPEATQQEPQQDPGVELVATFEGSRSAGDGKIYSYNDGLGNQIIGYGHLIQPHEQQSGTITIDGEAVPFAIGISAAQAKALLDQDLKPIRQEVDKLVAVELTNNQRAALASFMYNVGPQTFAESTLLKKLNAGEYDAVPAELMKFIRAGAEELPGLVTRRKAEIELWHKPDAPAPGKHSALCGRKICSSR